MAIETMVVGALKQSPIDDAVLELQLAPDDLDILAEQREDELLEEEEDEGLTCERAYCPSQYCAAGYSSE
jgi:hypothetical protein